MLGAASIGPKPPALCSIKNSSVRLITSMNGAEKLCRNRIDSTPRHTTNMFSSPEAEEAHPRNARHMLRSAATAPRPSPQSPVRRSTLWMPNQPQATIARSIAGMFAPTGPKLRAHKHRERNTILRAGVRVQQHRDQHDQVAQQDGADRLLPVHAAGDQAAPPACTSSLPSTWRTTARCSCRCSTCAARASSARGRRCTAADRA